MFHKIIVLVKLIVKYKLLSFVSVIDINGNHCHHNTESWSIHYTHWRRLFEYVRPYVSGNNRNHYILGTAGYGSFQLALSEEWTFGGVRYNRILNGHVR